MKVGLTLSQRRDGSTDAGPTLDQPTLLFGDGGDCLVVYYKCASVRPNVHPDVELLSRIPSMVL